MNCEIRNLENAIRMKQQRVASMESRFHGVRLDFEEVLHLSFEIDLEKTYIRQLKQKLNKLKGE